MKKLAIIVAGILALYFVPALKEAYDSIFETVPAALGMELSDFETAFFKSLPLVLLGMIVFGTIWKLFWRKDEGGGGE